MRRFLVPLLLLFLFGEEIHAQSLAEAARKEAERRKSLEQQGIKGKIINSESLGPNSGAAVTTSKLPGTPGRPEHVPSSGSNRRTVAAYRSALLRLDQKIRQYEDRFAALKRRYEEEKDTLPRLGRITGRNAAGTARERIRRQIEEMEVRLRRLRQDRLETYDAGRKAGFMPGELDGHGVVP